MGTKKGAAGSACCRCSFTGRRGENLRKERDDYYRHLAAHPDAELLPLA